MTNQVKTAIKSAEERLENERSEQVKTEVYNFLKSALSSIENIDKQIRALNEEKRVHEENVKNVKAGNLDAIEKRRQALNAQWQPFSFSYSSTLKPQQFFNDFVAGVVIDIGGKRYIF